MPKLPDETSLPRVRANGTSQDIRVPGLAWGTVDAGNAAQARGMQAIGEGIGAAAKGFGAYLADQASVDDFDTKKKELDFKYKTEMALEDYKRRMPPGGDGFTSGWQAEYERLAREFVGERDANIPASMRNRVGLALKQHELGLSERAQRYEWGEKDKATVEGLESTLGQLRSFVEADPSRKDEKQAEGRDIIMSAPIPPAERYRLAKKYGVEIEKTAIISRGMKIESAEDRDALKRDIGPELPDKRSSSILPGAGKIGQAAGWAARNPEWQKLDGHQKAALMALMEADGARPEDARNALGAMINRAAKNGEDLGAHVSQKIYQPTIEPAQEARIGQLMQRKEFADLTEWSRRRAAGKEADPVNGATHFLAHERTMLALEAREPGKYRSWRSWTGFDPKTGEYRGVITRDGSHAFLAPDGVADTKPMHGGDGYAGPYSTLTLQERKALWNQIDGEWAKKIATTQGVITKQMAASADGVLPRQDVIDELDRRVRGYKDPALTAAYGEMLARAEITKQSRAALPEQIDEFARRQRAMLDERGGTKDEDDRVKHLEKLAVAARKEVNENALGRAAKAGIAVDMTDGKVDANLDPGQQAAWRRNREAAFDLIRQGRTEEAMQQYPGLVRKVELERLDWNSDQIDRQLADRMRVANGVAGYYKQPIQAFTPPERDALKDALKVGGPRMLDMMGRIAAQAESAGVDAGHVFREIAGKDAPEVAAVGHLVASKADPATLDVASKALKWRIGMGENFKPTIDRTQVTAEVGDYAEVLKTAPTARDSVQALAGLVYEYEARAKGLTTFDKGTYDDVVHRIMGQTKDARTGQTFGGLGYQFDGWFDGRRHKQVLVPPGIVTEKFDAMKSAITASDLAKIGAQPVDERGNPYSVAEVRAMQWVSVGPKGAPPVAGAYLLKAGEDAAGNPVYALSAKGVPIVIDVRDIIGDLAKRDPSLVGR